MALRDLGYRAYEGARTPHSRNTWTMMRHGLSRAWASWMVKIVAFVGWVPPVIALAIAGLMAFTMAPNAPPEMLREMGFNPPANVRDLFDYQMWMFATLLTTGAGAGVIAEDLTHKAFQFYFSKPVTPVQYLAGRTVAVSIWVFCFTFIPAFLLIVLFAGSAAPDLRLEYSGLIFPAFFYSVLMSVVMSGTAVGISSLGKSRALTMTAWVMLLLIPHSLAALVEAVSEWPWLRLTSITAMLKVVGDALFKIEPTNDIRWYHALPLLIAVTAGGLYMAYRRIRTAKVIA